MHLKLALIFTDRVGIVAEISALMAEQGMNISSMEVEKKGEHAHVFVEAEENDIPFYREKISSSFADIPGLIHLRFIDIMPQKEKENRVRVVLDNISDGVISVDKSGNVTTINKVTRDVMRCKEEEVVGRPLKELKLPDYSLLECLDGKKYDNVKKNFITRSDRYQYFTTGHPIFDSEKRVIGAVEIAKDMQEIRKLAKSISEPDKISFSDIIGKHPAILAAIGFAQKIASSDSIISIRGESGTGKELFARAIHTASKRPGPFVPLNCAALPEQLLESELFGYVSGAFTGGKREGKAGLFEYAGQGTVFLDEIGEMPPASQAKILRVIQDKRVRRIGGTKEIPVNTRIITATHRNLEHLVEKKQFRQDLYYRINVLPIHIPPLCQRLEDIGLLVEHFLFHLASKLDAQTKTISNSALGKLNQHNWPGNVRELKNVIDRAAILSEHDVIDVSSIFFSHETSSFMLPAMATEIHNDTESFSLKKALADYEQKLLKEVLGNAKSIRQASRNLGISHTALLKKMQKYNLSQ